MHNFEIKIDDDDDFNFTDGVVLGKAGGQQTYGCVFCDLKKPYPREAYNLMNFGAINKLHQVIYLKISSYIK